ncbi:RNA 2',3'-cyclic phosphodiesterase [Jeotgalibacillus haloalkalitolerans]|uniref:RNA 2',3'-cyclic phosphodiesterase n=1 Tax=Jeotgalibacillus haloalkalitolerans TaxID=3104292 RepID=A0ABU5KMN9_9BACL|nr:RNA 2',3'-cyclic phosphodiesterase [Jeotgalibacillus sp. HH7-29]MDZ5712524.1 RNA 2',3'-cyclic phosphodiesterase [Jeotgalibacillus sp. HH7-29]
MENHYFIACTLSDEAKSKLHTIRESLLTADKFKKETDQADLHVTLSFLGAVSEDQLNIVCNALDKKIKEHRAFKLTFNYIHTFGPEDSPRVWWAGPEESEALSFLYQTVQEAVSKIHKGESRPFRPHVTLAKKWKGEPASVYRGPIKAVTDLIKQVTVYEIHPGETPMYKTYYSMKLIESGENNGTAD